MILLGLSIDTFFRHDFSSKLSRYETSLQRQLTRLLTELRDVQSRRKNDLPEGQEGSWIFGIELKAAKLRQLFSRRSDNPSFSKLFISRDLPDKQP